MSRKASWLCVGLVCLLGIVLLATPMAIQAQTSRQDSIFNKDAPSYTMTLPIIEKDFPTLTIWNWWDDDLQQEFQNILHDYTLLHPEVSVQFEYITDMDAALIQAIPAGAGPEIVYAPIDKICQWVSAGYLAPLGPVIDLSYMTANFEPNAVMAEIYNGQIWGIPDSQEGIALVYNRDMITDTELPASDDFNSLMAKAAQFQQDHPGKYYFCNQGLGDVDSYHAAPIYFGFGLDNFDGYLDANGNANMNTPEALNAAEWINDIRPYSPVITSYMICSDMFMNGEAAIWWTGPWAIPSINDSGINYGIASMGSPFVGVRNFVLTSNAVDRGRAAMAIDLLKYLGSYEVQKRQALANQTIPANTAALNDPEVQAIYEVRMFGASLGLGIPIGNHIYTACQWNPVGEATLALWNGSLTPEEAMEAAQLSIETCVAGINP